MSVPPIRHVRRPLSLRSTHKKRPFSQQAALGLGLGALMVTPGLQAEEEVVELEAMQIEDRTLDTNPYAEPNAPYKAKTSGDSRHTRPLAETPQTITVLTSTQMEESGRTDLKEVLQSQPGITIGTGENGNAFGDRYIIRGHEARSDVFVDGLRDPGMTTRESFATDQIEITKGPSSTFAGRGSTGGAVNGITKQASTDYGFTKLKAGVGTDDYYRLTLDSNVVVSDSVAIRANLLQAEEDVPDRSPANRERTGAAFSTSFQATDRLNLVFDYYYLEAKDKPDLGTYIVSGGGDPVDDIPVYLQDQDFLESEVDTYTLRLNYDVNDNVRIENKARYGTTENGYVVTGARGTTTTDTAGYDSPPGTDTISLSTHQGWQEVEYFANQFNVFWENIELFAMNHDFLVSLEYSDLNVVNGTFNVVNGGTNNCEVSGRGGANPGFCGIDENGNTVANINSIMGRQISRNTVDSDYNVETISIALMDTVDLTEDWTLFLGIRYDDFDYGNDVTRGGTTTEYAYSDGLWNSHLGVVYDLTDNGILYATWSTSSNINGGESDVGGSCGYGGLCGTPEQVTENDPESTTNLEIGSKWNLNDEKLLATVALFQITKDDVMESIDDDDYATTGTINTGKNRVQGAEFGLSGNLTPKLSTQFGVTFMSSEILKSYTEENEGRKLSNFADEQAFLQLRYQLTDKFAFGGIASYSSPMHAGQPDTAAGYNDDINDYSYTIPSYTVFDAFASYEFTNRLKAQLNITNLTDEDYYLASYRSGAFTYIGDARQAVVSFTYDL